MDWKRHVYRVGSHTHSADAIPPEGEELDAFVATSRKHIEPWLSAVFQAEHLNVLIGSGFTTAVARLAGAGAAGMGTVKFNSSFDAAIDKHAEAGAKKMNRGGPNIEDQLRSALAVLEGLRVTDAGAAAELENRIAEQLLVFLNALLKAENDIASGVDNDALTRTRKRDASACALQSFLLSFASRAASRERLHIFTTNYDRLIEHGCDLAGLRTIDRFVGALNPVFRSMRVEVDIHYNPPGIRGEPRFMEGVVRLTKLHGSLDWEFNPDARLIRRKGIPFGAPAGHTEIPKTPVETVMIYPNAAKDVETTAYPYAELFRDFAAATCRPNAVVVTYGYGFGDDHVNRVLLDMLTIPSTHLVVITFSADDRLKAFCSKARDAQLSVLIGPHFASLSDLVENYLPKPALDTITGRVTELLKHRPQPEPQAPAAALAPAAPTDKAGDA